MNAIVAVSENWGIGKDNALLFHIRADLQRFKALTTGHTVVMGRRTLESLPGGRGLPGRRNLVLSTRPDFAAERAEVVRSLDEAVAAAEEDAFVIGGETVYRALLARCERVYVTKVFAAADADAFFPRSRRCAGLGGGGERPRAGGKWPAVSVCDLPTGGGVKYAIRRKRRSRSAPSFSFGPSETPAPTEICGNFRCSLLTFWRGTQAPPYRILSVNRCRVGPMCPAAFNRSTPSNRRRG